jgi:hypothetical protein
MILLVADLGDYKADPTRPAIGTVIEAQRDKGRGPIATVIVQTGTLRIGDAVVAGAISGKVRSLETTDGARVKVSGPSTAVVISGLPEVPASGDVFRVAGTAARNVTGIAAGTSGLAILLVNVGSFALTLKHQSASSSAANRFTVPWAGDCVLPASGGAVVLVYDSTSSTWRVV